MTSFFGYIIIIIFMIIQEKKHEILSQLIFKKILLDNPKVLATFVSPPFELDMDHVKNIEEMIAPKKVVYVHKEIS